MENMKYNIIKVSRTDNKRDFILRTFSKGSVSDVPVLAVNPGQEIKICLDEGIDKATIWFAPDTVYTRWFYSDGSYSPTAEAKPASAARFKNYPHLNVVGRESGPFPVAEIPMIDFKNLPEDSLVRLIIAIFQSDREGSAKLIPKTIHDELRRNVGPSTNGIIKASLASIRDSFSGDVFRSSPKDISVLSYILAVSNSETELPTSLGEGDGAAGKLNVSTG